MEPLEEIRPRKKWFLSDGSTSEMCTEKWAKNSNWSKFTCFTHHIHSEFGFQNLRSIVIQNGTFRINKAMKKMVFRRKDRHRKC